MHIADSADFNVQSNHNHKPETRNTYYHTNYRFYDQRREESRLPQVESRPKSANPRAKQQQQLYSSMIRSKKHGLDEST